MDGTGDGGMVVLRRGVELEKVDDLNIYKAVERPAVVSGLETVALKAELEMLSSSLVSPGREKEKKVASSQDRCDT